MHISVIRVVSRVRYFGHPEDALGSAKLAWVNSVGSIGYAGIIVTFSETLSSFAKRPMSLWACIAWCIWEALEAYLKACSKYLPLIRL